MFAFWLVYVIVAIRASPPRHIRDDFFLQDLTEDGSSLPVEPTNTNIFDDGTLISSAAFPDDESTGDLFPNSVDGGSGGGASAFGQDFDMGESFPMEGEIFDPSLLGVNGEGEESFIGNMAFTPNSFDAEENSPIDLMDSSISTAPCNSQSSSFMENFDSSDSASLPDLDENSNLIASDDQLTPEQRARHKPSWRYTVEPTYPLSDEIGPNTDTTNAYADDGTALRPSKCPEGSKKSCCVDNTFMACWKYPNNVQVCRKARNLYCCGKIPVDGGPGVECEPIKWVYARSKPGRVPPSNKPDQLQGIFDMFQIPDLNPDPNPNYCPNPGRL